MGWYTTVNLQLVSTVPNLCCRPSENILHTRMSQPQLDPRDNLVELPLFPLNVVLFPGMPMPLHIFEERYKAMIGDCLERDAPFGIVLIKEGKESGEPAEPVQIGTTARIVQSESLPEGRMNIMTKGEHRFELVEIIQRMPHLVGQVRYLADDAGDGLSSAITEIREGYATFLRNLTAMAGGWTSQAEVPEDPVTLSFAVASSLASSIEMPGAIRQELLELPTARERLDRLLPLLNQGNEALAEEVAKRNPFKGPRLN